MKLTMSCEQRRHLLPLLDFICFVSKQSNDEQLRFPRRLNGSLTDRLHYSTANTSSKMSKLSVNDKVSISLGHVVTRQLLPSCEYDSTTTSRKHFKKESDVQVSYPDAIVGDFQDLTNFNQRDDELSTKNAIGDAPCCDSKIDVNVQPDNTYNNSNKVLLFDLRDNRAKILKKLYIGKECLFLEDNTSTFFNGCIIDIDAHEGKAQIVPYNSVNKVVIWIKFNNIYRSESFKERDELIAD